MTKTTTYLTVKASSSTTSTTDLDWKKYRECPISRYSRGYLWFHPCIGYKGKSRYNPLTTVRNRSKRVCNPSAGSMHNCYQSSDGDITCNPSYVQTWDQFNKDNPYCNFTGKADHYTGIPKWYKIDNLGNVTSRTNWAGHPNFND